MSSPFDDDAKIQDEAAAGDENPNLRRELARLDGLLAGDENWQALRRLDERGARGELLEPAPALNLRRILEHQLAPNRVFRAHRKIEEALAILEGTDGKAAAPKEAARGPVIDHGAPEAAGNAFRTQVKIKLRPQAEPAAKTESANRPATAAPAASLPRQTDPGIAGLVQIAAWRYQDVMRSRQMASQTDIADESSATLESESDRAAIEPATASAPEAPTGTAGPDAALAADLALQLPFGIKAPAPEPVEPAAAAGAILPIAADKPHADPIAGGRLTAIKGIDEPLAARLERAGFTATGQISRWSAADVAAVDQNLDLGGRISRENWIEQAAMLDDGEATAFSARAKAGDFDCLVAPPHHSESRLTGETLSCAPASAVEPPARAVPEPLTVPLIVPDAEKRASGQVPAAIATIAGAATITAATSSSARDMGGEPVQDGPARQPPAPSSPGAPAPAASAPTMPVPTMPVPTESVPTESVPTESVPSDYTGDFLSQPFVAETVPRPVGNREAAAAGAMHIAEGSVSAFAPPRRLSQAVMEARADTMPESGEAPVALELRAAPAADIPADPAPARQPESASRPGAIAGAGELFIGPDIGEAEVQIVSDGAEPKTDSTENPADEPGGKAAPGNAGPISDTRESRNETHAAYHSQTDEASVVIVKREAGQEQPDLPFYKQNKHWQREGKISRFLKALTGD